MGNPADWLNIADSARHTGASEYMIRRALDSGELIAYKFGGKIQLRRSDLDRWMEPTPIRVTRNQPIDLDSIAR